MAGDWLKVETVTPDKPEMKHIARVCKVSMDTAFASWFRLWRWFDSVTADGRFAFLTPEDCDEEGKLPGLGRALSEVGWVEFTADGGALVRNWERHNGQSAKKRLMANRRKIALRGRAVERVGNAGSVPFT